MSEYKITHLIPAPANTFAVVVCHREQRCWLHTVVSLAAIEADGLVPHVVAIGTGGMPMQEEDTTIVAADDQAPNGKTWNQIATASKGPRTVGVVEVDYSNQESTGFNASDEHPPEITEEMVAAYRKKHNKPQYVGG